MTTRSQRAARPGAAALALAWALLVCVGCEREAGGPGAAGPEAPARQSRSEAGTRASVVGRLGADLARPAGLPELARIRLERVSRPGFCAGVPFAFEVRPPAAPDALSFAVGVRPNAVGAQGGTPELALRVEQGERVLAERALGERDRWYTLRLPLEASNARAPLRLSVRGGDSNTSACWGSIDFERREAANSQSPNVVLVSLDTLGAPYLASHGGLAQISPRIDAFLAESFELRRTIAQFGNTLVSHSSLFSGQYPRVHQRYSGDWGHKPPPLDSLIEALAAAGYRTAAFTENGYVASQLGFDTGFDFYDNGTLDVGPGDAARTFGRAERWLEERGRDTRFFLFVHTYEVHSPYVPKTPEGRALADRLTPGDRRIFNEKQTNSAFVQHLRGEALLTKREQRRLKALYNAEILEVDALFGRLLDALDALDLARGTLVVLTSDHGEIFGENGAYAHGVSLHNRILNVPLAFRWPGRIEPGRSEQTVELIDGLVTVLDLLGLEVPASEAGRRRDGRSLAPLMQGGEASDASQPAFSEELRPLPHCPPGDADRACWVEHYSVQSERFKLVRSRDGSYERFYDLSSDPNEIRSAREDASNREALAEHRAWLDEYLRNTPEPPLEFDPEGEGAVDEETRARLEALGYVF